MLGALLGAIAVPAAWASEQPANLVVAEARVTGSPALVAAAVVEEMTERQFFLVGQSGSELRFARPVDNADLRAKLGSLEDPLPQARVIVSFAQDSAQTAVHSDFFIITHPGSMSERVADARALGIDPRLQEMLDGIDGTVQAIAAREAKIEKTALAQIGQAGR
jgi:hypothetical protein